MQRRSTKLQDVSAQHRDAEQLPLIPDQRAVSRPADVERIYRLANTHEALEYGMELARLAPKQVYPHMDCDKTVWSRIMSGEFDLDGRDIRRFNSAVNNDAYLLYLNHIHGYDLTTLRKVQDDKERENAELRQKVADYERLFQLAFTKGKG